MKFIDNTANLVTHCIGNFMNLDLLKPIEWTGPENFYVWSAMVAEMDDSHAFIRYYMYWAAEVFEQWT